MTSDNALKVGLKTTHYVIYIPFNSRLSHWDKRYQSTLVLWHHQNKRCVHSVSANATPTHRDTSPWVTWQENKTRMVLSMARTKKLQFRAFRFFRPRSKSMTWKENHQSSSSDICCVTVLIVFSITIFDFLRVNSRIEQMENTCNLFAVFNLASGFYFKYWVPYNCKHSNIFSMKLWCK